MDVAALFPVEFFNAAFAGTEGFGVITSQLENKKKEEQPSLSKS
jgi:hypothetical protein